MNLSRSISFLFALTFISHHSRCFCCCGESTENIHVLKNEIEKAMKDCGYFTGNISKTEFEKKSKEKLSKYVLFKEESDATDAKNRAKRERTLRKRHVNALSEVIGKTFREQALALDEDSSGEWNYGESGTNNRKSFDESKDDNSMLSNVYAHERRGVGADYYGYGQTVQGQNSTGYGQNSLGNSLDNRRASGGSRGALGSSRGALGGSYNSARDLNATTNYYDPFMTRGIRSPGRASFRGKRYDKLVKVANENEQLPAKQKDVKETLNENQPGISLESFLKNSDFDGNQTRNLPEPMCFHKPRNNSYNIRQPGLKDRFMAEKLLVDFPLEPNLFKKVDDRGIPKEALFSRLLQESISSQQSRAVLQVQLKGCFHTLASGAACCKRWTYVKDYYIRRRGKPGSGGEAAKKRSDLLSFLDIIPSSQRNSITNVAGDDLYESEITEGTQTDFEENIFHIDETENMTRFNCNEHKKDADKGDVSKDEFMKEKKKKKLTHSEERLQLLKEIAQRKATPAQNELDETDLFFNSMAKIVKKLPRYEQIQLRMQIASSVGNAELRSILIESRQTEDSSRPSASFPNAMVSPTATNETYSEEDGCSYSNTLDRCMGLQLKKRKSSQYEGSD